MLAENNAVINNIYESEELNMKQRIFYQVRVIQEVPFWDYDMDEEEAQVSTGYKEEYVAGTFSAEHNAKLFAKALEERIAEKNGYVTNCFTPRVSIIRIRQTEELLDKCDKNI